MTHPKNVDLEAPEADVAEQMLDAEPDEDGEDEVRAPNSIEAPEWDALEQARSVRLDDDYR
jgi:hypothetical protein